MDVPDGIPVPAGEENKSLREAIIKTANHVKQHGPAFEEKLKGNATFSYVNPDNQYYEYYQYLRNHDAVKGTEPREPYPFSFMTYDKNISPKDLEIIKTTAAFCVANENINYLDKMKANFAESPQFSFLKSDHSLNAILVQFINQYKQVKSNALGPPTFDYENEDYKSTLLRRCFQRAEYYEYAKELESEKEQLAYLRKIQFAAFDWTNFKLVGKIELEDTDNQPLNFGELSLKKIDRSDTLSLFDEKESQTNKETKGRKRKVKAAGETRMKRKRTENEVSEIECPITHKMVPEDKFDKHLQVLLGDPHYSAEREKYKTQHKLSNLSSEGVFENIKKLARNTTGL